LVRVKATDHTLRITAGTSHLADELRRVSAILADAAERIAPTLPEGDGS